MFCFQVVTASKFIMRKESTRDYADLLLSTKHWPVVLAVDMACDVVAHIETSHPNLANALWKDRRGCFEKPSLVEKPKVSACVNKRSANEALPLQVMHHPEFSSALETPTCTIEAREKALADHTYSKAMTHPLTGTVDRYIVGDRFHDGDKTSGHKKETCKFHHLDLCPELAPYQSVTSEVLNSKIKSTRLQSSNQQNIVHYFVYNRLMDHWSNMAIVEKQREKMMKNAQAGETVVRDKHLRFLYVCSRCFQCGHTELTCAQMH